jgi:hypothetical protein
MTDILTRLAALTAKDERGILPFWDSRGNGKFAESPYPELFPVPVGVRGGRGVNNSGNVRGQNHNANTPGRQGCWNCRQLAAILPFAEIWGFARLRPISRAAFSGGNAQRG